MTNLDFDEKAFIAKFIFGHRGIAVNLDSTYSSLRHYLSIDEAAHGSLSGKSTSDNDLINLFKVYAGSQGRVDHITKLLPMSEKLSSVLSWIVRPEAMTFLSDYKIHNNLRVEKSKTVDPTAERIAQQEYYKTFMKLEQEFKAARRLREQQKESSGVAVHETWGREKKPKLEDDGNSWREQK